MFKHFVTCTFLIFVYLGAAYELLNGGKKCLAQCKWARFGEGPCGWCGSKGMCCKLDKKGGGCDGTIGGLYDHTCVLKKTGA